MLGALACALPHAQAEDHAPAPVPAPAPAPAPSAPVIQPQPLPPRPADQGPPRRARQMIEVIPVENAEALAAKLQELAENGLFITTVTAITASGKPAVVVIGMPQPAPPQRPPMAQQPRPGSLGGPSAGPGQPPPAAPQATPQLQAPPPPAKP